MTYDEIMNLEIEFVDNPEFPNLDPKKMMSEPMPEGGRKSPKPGKELPDYMRHLYSMPLLTKEQEFYLFQRMNYIKFLATQIRVGLLPRYKGKIEAINWSLTEALRIRNLIVESNLRIVANIAKKHAYITPRRGIYSSKFEDCISDGHMGLIRAVELFDYSKGFTFATYGFNSVKNVMLRGDKTHRKQDSRFKVEADLPKYPDERYLVGCERIEYDTTANPLSSKEDYRHRESFEGREIVDKLLPTVSGRERNILVARYGLDGNDPMTLKEIGDLHGITRERTRQILQSIIQEFRGSLR